MALIWDVCGSPEPSKFDLWKYVKPAIRDDLMKHKKPRRLREFLKEKNTSGRIDDQLIDLLDNMLRVEPNRRITAKQALDHPFFKTDPLPSRPEDIKMIEEESHEYIVRMSKKQADKGEKMRKEMHEDMKKIETVKQSLSNQVFYERTPNQNNGPTRNPPSRSEHHRESRAGHRPERKYEHRPRREYDD